MTRPRHRSRPRPGRAAPLLAALLAGAVALAAEERGTDIRDLPRSEDDRGFSILLMSPTDLFLTGRHTLRIEAIIPRGDVIEQVDFFLDGRLLSTDRRAPYESDADFGRDIRRRTIEIRATTRAGRRAKVSLVTRSGDVSEGASGRIVAVPVVARQPTGPLIEDLGVSDIVLSEDGAPRPIAYFTPGPFPASIAVVVDPGAAGPAAFAAPLARFLRALPSHDATALVEGDFATREAAAQAFSFDPAPAIARLEAQAAGGGWEGRVRAAATALGERRGLRVLVVVLGTSGGSQGARDLLEDPAAPALEAALEAGATVYAVVVGGVDEAPPRDALREAAGRSGGGLHEVDDAAGLERATQEIAAEMRHRYVIGFVPSEEARPGWRAIQVRLRSREAAVVAPRSVFLR